jgi:hypothetical protein
MDILSDGNDAIDVTQETSVVPTNELTAIALVLKQLIKNLVLLKL